MSAPSTCKSLLHLLAFELELFVGWVWLLLTQSFMCVTPASADSPDCRLVGTLIKKHLLQLCNLHDGGLD